MSDTVKRAEELFLGGCACSQAVLAAFSQQLGLSDGEAVRVAAGFAGGMRMAETCGAVTGAFMALGLAHCDNTCRTADGRQAAYAAVTSFADDFRKRHGSLVCRDLLGCDISTPEGAARASADGLTRRRCPQFVRDAAAMVEARLPARVTP